RCPPSSTLFPYTTLFRSPEAQRVRGLRQLRTRIKPSGANVSHCHGRIAGGHCPAVAAGRGWEKAGQRLRYDPEPSRSHVVVHERSEEHTSELQSRENLVC